MQFGNMPQGMGFGAARLQHGADQRSNMRNLQAQLENAQLYGQNPAILADLQRKYQWAQEDMNRNNQMGYIQQMMRHRGLGGVGQGGMGGVDPFLNQLLMAQWGMGGGPIG